MSTISPQVQSILVPHIVAEINGEKFDSWTKPNFFNSARLELTSDKSGSASISVLDSDFVFNDKVLSA